MDTKTLADNLGLATEDFLNRLTFGSTADGAPSTQFGATGGLTVVRGGGLGSSAYVARIVGTDREWGFKREFVPSDKNLSRSGASGNVHFIYEGDGLYCYGRVTESSSRVRGGYFLVLDGKVADLPNDRAGLIAAVAALEDAAVAA